MANGIRKLRLRYGYTQQDLAEKLETTADQVSRWERGLEALTVPQVIDLSIVLGCGAGPVLGREIGVEERRASPFAIFDEAKGEELYGTLSVVTKTGKFKYPISHRARGSIRTQLRGLDIVRERDNTRPWLHCWSMDNKIVYINPRKARMIRLIDDNDSAAPAHAHPQVFRALYELEEEGDESWGPVLRAAVNDWVESKGSMSKAERAVSNFRIIYEDGSRQWCPLIEDDDVMGFFCFDLSSYDVARNTFLQIEAEPETYLNMETTMIVEVPADQYHRLTSPEMLKGGHLRLVAEADQ